MKHLSYFLIMIISGILLIVPTSCKNKKETASEMTPYEKTEGNKIIATGPIIYKSFVKKNGQETDIKEAYLQQSIQDYFIKFCESKVTQKELDDYLAKQNCNIKTATLEIEIRDGTWDVCDGNMEQQSRIGKYVVIWRIVK